MRRKQFRINGKVLFTACLIGVLPLQSQFIFASGSTSAAVATPQSVKITGKVVDATTGEPVIGCSVVVKGTSTGTITDANGNFKIEASESAVLSVSYVGYTKTEVKAQTGGMVIKISEDTKMLNEVVVTSLGIKREKKALGYTVTDVNPDELAKASSVNLITALQGKAAGVQITTSGGGVQSSSKIVIRGNRSLKNNGQPIIVMDGVIIENDASSDGQWGAVIDQGNQMKNLNPDDFESISVLKGAAASALYGSRAQNGVILITSKKGKKNKAFGVNIKQSTDFESVYDGPDFQNEFGVGYGATVQWQKYVDPKTNLETGEKQIRGDYTSISFGPRFDGSTVRDYDGTLIQWVAHPDNWKAGYQTAHYNNTNVTISGGTDKSTFRLSYGLNDSKGITLNNKFKRNNISFRATHEFNSILSVDAGATYTLSESKNPVAQGGNDSQLFQWAYGFSRNNDILKFKNNYIDKVYGGALYNNGSEDYAGASWLWWDLNKNDRTLKENVFKGNVDLNFTFTDWLSLSLKANYYSLVGQTDNNIAGDGKGFTGGSYETGNSNTSQYQGAWMLKMHKKYNDWDLGLNVGGETNHNVRRSFRMWTKGGLKTPEQFMLSNNVSGIEYTQGLPREKIINSFYGMGNITYKDQIYLDLTARNDYSSSLIYPDGHGNPSYFYPSAAVSWLFNETFKLPQDVLSFGKIKASLAWTGNDADVYKTNQGFAYRFIENYIDKDGTIVPSYNFDSESIGNLYLKNELTRTHEFGTELKFLQNRIGLDATYYKSYSYNQILSLPTTLEAGASSKTINSGKISNEGIEIVLTATPIKTKDFMWMSTLTYSKNKNKIIDLAAGVPQYDLEYGMGMDVKTVAIPGGNYGDIQTKYAFARYQALDASGNKVDDPHNGMKVLRYAPKTNTTYVRSSDYQGQGYVTVGNMNPDFMSTWTNGFTYKDFSFDFMIDSRFGGDILSASYNYGIANGNYKSSLWGREGYGGIPFKDGTMVDGKEVTKYGVIPEGVFQKGEKGKGGQDLTGMTWKEAYDKGYVDPLETFRYYRALGSWGTGIRENAIHECSWVMLRQVSVSYNVPKRFLSKTKYITDASLTLVGKNLFYLYNSLPDNINPQGASYNNSAGGSAFEYGGSPYTRSFGFIVNLSF